MEINHIFILAGGLTDTAKNNSWVIERMKIAMEIKGNNIYYCIGGGTYHKPNLIDNSGYVIYESNKMIEYLISNNIEKDKIKHEWSSYDTIGNGFFSFLNFIIPLKLNKIFVITSKFHMKRVQIIFNYFKKLFNIEVIIEYINSNNNMDREILKIREKREKDSYTNFYNLTENIKTIEDFYYWFYNIHDAYNCKKYNTLIDNTDLKNSY